jgi:hypothetical protein
MKIELIIRLNKLILKGYINNEAVHFEGSLFSIKIQIQIYIKQLILN